MNDIQDSSDNKKHLLLLMKLAGFLIGASLLLTLGLSKGLLGQGVVERAFGVLLGLVMAVCRHTSGMSHVIALISSPCMTSSASCVLKTIRTSVLQVDA